MQEIITRRLICHHIEIYPEHRKFLGFEWIFEDGSTKYLQFCILPFGLSSAYGVFTKVLSLFTKSWRGIGIKTIIYLYRLQHLIVSRQTKLPANSSKMFYGPGQNIWNKIEKSSKIGKEKKGFISPFACFLIAIAKV